MQSEEPTTYDPISHAKKLQTTLLSTVFVAVEVLCIILLINSMRYLTQPTWAEKKLAELQSIAKFAIADQQSSSNSSNQASVPSVAITTTSNAASKPTPTKQPTAAKPSELDAVLTSVFGVLPDIAAAEDYKITNELVDLGRMLYYDPRLSSNDSVSCNSCHLLDKYGVDGIAFSIGANAKPVDRNAPTVYNAALHISQFWDGRSPTVEDQATKPILASGEMGMVDEEKVKERFTSIPAYAAMFKAAFPNDQDPINLKNMGMAIGAFERGLLTPSRFDQFVAGDRTALNEQEVRGLTTFISARCVTCHMGATVGGLAYKRLGDREPYPTTDTGRYKVTKNEEDKFIFKVPSLLNVAETAPYLHDGSIETLEETVEIMARYQLAKILTEQEIQDIVAFLKALTGDLPKDYIKEPELPEEDAQRSIAEVPSVGEEAQPADSATNDAGEGDRSQ